MQPPTLKHPKFKNPLLQSVAKQYLESDRNENFESFSADVEGLLEEQKQNALAELASIAEIGFDEKSQTTIGEIPVKDFI